MAKHVLVIFNPAAKSQVQTEQWIGKLVEELNKHDEYLVSFFPTTADTEPHNLVPLFRPPLDLIIAAGGDGTVRFAMAALAKAQSDIPVAIFPLGTGNVLARNLGIVDVSLFANPLERAYDYIINGRPLRIDMGMMNGEYFAGMAGVGPISDAFMTPHRTEKTRFKLLAYVKALINSIGKPARTFKISTGGTTFKVQAGGIFVGNVKDLGIGKEVELDIMKDGYLDLHIVNPTNFKQYYGLGFRYATGSSTEHTPDYSLKVKEAVIELVPRLGVRTAFQQLFHKMVKALSFSDTEEELQQRRDEQLPCMIDGEECGLTPMRITVIPQSVNVLVPSERFQVAMTEEHRLGLAS